MLDVRPQGHDGIYARGEFNLRPRGPMKPSAANLVIALGLAALVVAIGGAGIYIGDTMTRPEPR